MANLEHLKRLRNAIDTGIEEWNTWRSEHPQILPDLRNADLSGAYLKGAYLTCANLTRANLSNANLSKADLTGAYLYSANLNGADLSGSKLIGADICCADLCDAKLTRAQLGSTTLGDLDLSTVNGLDSVRHQGPSTIGIDTIYRSEGKISDAFLKGCGIPENFIQYAHSLVGCAFEFYSCFISYSSKDEAFAERLYADLQNTGVRCWFAPEDLKIGEETRLGIDTAIRKYDKLLLILSKTSVTSDWVEHEVEFALEKERREKRPVLFPVRMDDAVMKIQTGWPAHVRINRNIGDFRKWRDHDSYHKGFERLLRDLKPEQES